MDFEINNVKEMNKINSFLNRSIKQEIEGSLDSKIYEEVLSIADGKIDLIAHEMHLIMNSKNHSYNFLPDNEAWETYRDSALNGPTMFQGLLEDQLHLLAKKVSSKLDSHYLKAITYFYSDDLDFEAHELLIDSLSSEIGWSALSEIQGVLHNIAEKEQELEGEQLAEMEEEEERKAYEIELYSDIETLTKRQKVNLRNIEKNKRFYSRFRNNETLKIKNVQVQSILKELAEMIEHQEEKLEYYNELNEIQVKKTSKQLDELNKKIFQEKKQLGNIKFLEFSFRETKSFCLIKFC
jgi:hypothetical protein